MKNVARKIGLFQCISLVLVLFGCAAAVDDAGLPPAEEATDATTQELSGAVLDANAADCDAPALSAGVSGGTYEELSSILETARLNDDGSLEAASTCRRVCACCKRGNRFCCSHCRFCSGPIGPYGLSDELMR